MCVPWFIFVTVNMDLNIPESAIRAVSKKLKHYIDVERREEGFDMSPSFNLTGHFSSNRGTVGTFFYNSLQDKHLQHYYKQPLVRKHLEDLGVLHPGMMMERKVRRRARSVQEQQRLSARMESERLMDSAAKLLLSSGYCSYYKKSSRKSGPACPQSKGSSSHKGKRQRQSSRSSHTQSTATLPHSLVSAATPPHSLVSTATPPHSLVSGHTTNLSTITPPSTPAIAANQIPSYPPSKSADTPPVNPPLTTTSPTHTPCTPMAAPRPLVRCSVGVSTVSSCEASTQTLVDASTQTDLSKLLERSMRLRKKGKTNIPSFIPTTSTIKQEPPTQPSNTSLTDHEPPTQPSNTSLTDQEPPTQPSNTALTDQEPPTQPSNTSLTDQEPPTQPDVHALAQTGDIAGLRELVRADSSCVHTLNEQGLSLLHMACAAGNDELAKAVCELGCDPSLETPTGYSAAHLAALNGHTHCLKVLHTLGCDIDCPTIDQKIPLHLAAMNGHMECCRWLVASGASVSSEDNVGRTPADVAMENSHTALQSVLSPSAAGETALTEGVPEPESTDADDEFWTN